MAVSQYEEIGARMLRLLAVARGLEDDGQYNAAKVFRAAAVSEANAATQEHPRPDSNLESEMAAVINEMKDADRGDVLVQKMEKAHSILSAGNWSTLADVPPTFVCRSCGEVTFESPPASCPGCGARPLTFEEFLPTYYLEAVEPSLLLEGLESDLSEVERITSGVTEEEATRGSWPLRDIVAHLLAADAMLTRRAVQMLEEDEPELVSFPPTMFVDKEPASTAELVQRFRNSRMSTLRRFRGLDASQWERGGSHPEWGRLTVRQQLSYILRHEQHHLAELELRRSGG